MLPNILMFHVHYVKPQSAGLQVLGKDFFLLFVYALVYRAGFHSKISLLRYGVYTIFSILRSTPLDQGFFGVIYDNLDVGDTVKRLPRISV